MAGATSSRARSASPDSTALTLDGGPGDDIVGGGDSKDVVRGGDGADIVTGGEGNDTMLWSHGDDNDVIDGNAGTDVLKAARLRRRRQLHGDRERRRGCASTS